MTENVAPSPSTTSDAPSDATSPDFGSAASVADSPVASVADSATSEQHGSTTLDPRHRTVIGLLLVSAFVVILNETIMGVALPRLMEDLNVEAHVGQWLTTAFMLTMAVVIPITGFLIQRFHTRTLFAAAMTLFSIGTLTSALAPGFEVLLIGRIIQASGTAIMMPLLMTTVMTLVPPAARGRMMGNISIVISVAPAVGPTISGLILSVLDWRWMFWLVLPIAIGSLILGLRRVENVTEPKALPIDVLSVILSVLGFGGLVYGLSSIGEAAGSAAVPVAVPFAVGGLGILAFVLRQLQLQRSDKALLDLRTFTPPIFTLSIVMMAVSMMALFGTLILVPIYLQTVLGVDPLMTGLLLLPGGLVMGLLAPFVGRLYDAFGPRPLLVPGSIVVSGALWSMTTLSATTPFVLVLVMHIALSIGLALLFTPLFTAGLGSVPPKLYSHGSAIIGTIQQLAGAAGTALFVTLMTVGAAAGIASGADVVDATADGIHTAFLVGAFISLAPIALSFFITKPAQPEGAPLPVGH